MHFDFNRQAISLACRFYARSLSFPYDELAHELHYLFREIEKNIETDLDNTVASKVLDVINSYQGEDMSALHAEYARLFSYVQDQESPVSMRVTDLDPQIDPWKLNDQIMKASAVFDLEDAPDGLPGILDLFSGSLEMDSDAAISDFYESFLLRSVPMFCEQVYRLTGLNFYKEVARGLSELIYLLRD